MNSSLKNDIFLQRAGKIAGVGGWHVDLATMEVEWSDQTCRILDFPAGHKPTLNDALSLYAPEARPVITSLIERAVDGGTPWDVELSMVTATGRPIWTRSIGEAEHLDGKVVAIAGAFQDITQRKNAEAEQQASLEATKIFYDDAPCGYYSIGTDKKFLRVNDRLLSWLGCTHDEVIGKKGPTDFMTAQSVANIELAFPRFIEVGEIHELECELLPVNGTVRHVSISATAIYDARGVFLQTRSVMYDITQRVQFREQAKTLAREQAAMLDNDLIGIAKMKDRKIVWANRAMHRIFGYADGTLIGLPSRTGFQDDASYVALGAQAYPVIQAGGTYRCEIEMVRQDGSPLWIHMNGVQLSTVDQESMWMMADITALKQNQDNIQRIAYHDALTGLPNRLLLNDRLIQAMAVAERQNAKLAVCYLDLDGFKAVNDHFGHEAGDKLLIELSKRLINCVRAHDTICRLGGDEFVLVLSSLDSPDELEMVLKRILSSIAERVELGDGLTASVTASIGVSMFPEDATGKELLLRHADHAMYQAKSLGKNRFLRFVGNNETTSG
jgi:diguanylate cyclase (GGDEF)-like protein/PAS domain S-box-containing protein